MEKESNYYDITLPDGSTIILPRVTSILRVINKEGLNIWRAKQGFELSEQTKEETADIGKEIHKLVAYIGQGNSITGVEWELLSEEIKNGLRAYVRWQREEQSEIVQAETLVYSLKYGYAGRPDRICAVAGQRGLELIDWKSGGTIWEEYIFQVAAYVMAWNEFIKKPRIRRARIVCLDRKTGVPIERVVLWPELRYAFRHGFLHAKGLWDYYEKKGKNGHKI